ncbi:MAG: VIT domain-containing protein [Planctomycetota bacterium]
MKRIHIFISTVFGIAAAGVLAASAMSQTVIPAPRTGVSHLIVPQSRSFVADRDAEVVITGVRVNAEISGQVATTCMEIDLLNRTNRRQEAEFLVPVPDGAIVRGFTFQGTGAEPSARVLPRDEARELYNSIVASERDPALLEFSGYHCIRSSLFPLEPRSSQRVRLTYEHLLQADGLRVDYKLPRSESIAYTLPWEISVTIRSNTPVATVYSPSHFLRVQRGSDGAVRAEVAPLAMAEPGSFLLSYLLEAKEGVSASIMAYPDLKTGGGYFLLLADLPEFRGAQTLRREVTVVLDRSGSMKGEKLDQARRAAQQVIAALDPGEAFNIITYSDYVDLFSEAAVLKTAETERRAAAYINSIVTRGGTNIYDALQETLRIRPAQGTLPIALFLTDGLPTLGDTSEKSIRTLVEKANPFHRRIFTFGVGVDVNTPLLDKIARLTRASAGFVLPGQEIDSEVARVFRRLAAPVLASPELKILGPDGRPMPERVRDLLPHELSDLYDNDQLVLLGTYTGSDPLRFRLTGQGPDGERSFLFTLDVDHATTRNAFVPRLWAGRKIAALVDVVRESGADPSISDASSDPRYKELVDEIVRLSLEFGILTEYTSFFAREGTDLFRRDRVMAEVMDNFSHRALKTRSGMAAVNQEINAGLSRSRSQLNLNNAHFDSQMQRVTAAQVQQVNDLAFYQQGSRWVDSRIYTHNRQIEPARVVVHGESGFNDLLQQLESEQRQGAVSLPGEILMEINGEPVLVRPISGK